MLKISKSQWKKNKRKEVKDLLTLAKLHKKQSEDALYLARLYELRAREVQGEKYVTE